MHGSFSIANIVLRGCVYQLECNLCSALEFNIFTEPVLLGSLSQDHSSSLLLYCCKNISNTLVFLLFSAIIWIPLTTTMEFLKMGCVNFWIFFVVCDFIVLFCGLGLFKRLDVSAAPILHWKPGGFLEKESHWSSVYVGNLKTLALVSSLECCSIRIDELASKS